jgi:hypothetical protein
MTMTKKERAEIEAALDEDAMRFPLPAAYADPAFVKCAEGAIETPELIAQFNRLKGCALGVRRSRIEQMVDEACGKDDMREFLAFVHDGIYLRLPNRAINAFRASALLPQRGKQ